MRVGDAADHRASRIDTDRRRRARSHRNATGHRLSSTGPTPLRLSAHVLDDDGRVARFDAERNWIHGGVPAHGSAWAGGVFRVDEGRRAVLRLTLVQEAVGWLDAGAFDLSLG